MQPSTQGRWRIYRTSVTPWHRVGAEGGVIRFGEIRLEVCLDEVGCEDAQWLVEAARFTRIWGSAEHVRVGDESSTAR